MKTPLMLLGLAAVFLLGTACAGLFATKRDAATEAKVPACAGLDGQARGDCERQHQQP